MSSLTSLRCVFTSFYNTIEIFEKQGLSDKHYREKQYRPQCTPVHFSALQCTPFFVTPVKRPLLNYHFFPDIRLDWESYNILPQDNQLLDMLVFVGQPLPVIQDGQEVVPAFQEQDCYLCEEKPLIQVKLREHEGIRANRPFEVTPSQQV